MDAAATIIFRSGGCGVYLRAGTIACTMYAYMRIIVRILYSASVASQVDEVFCFDIIVRGHHVYKTVWTLQRLERSLATSLAGTQWQSGYARLVGHSLWPMIFKCSVEYPLLFYCCSGHSQSFVSCLCNIMMSSQCPLRLLNVAFIQGWPLNGCGIYSSKYGSYRHTCMQPNSVLVVVVITYHVMMDCCWFHLY